MAKLKSRSYSELILIPSFEERFAYLSLQGRVGESTFGHTRFLNQLLYSTSRWRRIRDLVIVRDDGCDMAVSGHQIGGSIVVHHITPLTSEAIEYEFDICFDLENLVCVSSATHKAIHYGDDSLLLKDPVVRCAGDTKLW